MIIIIIILKLGMIHRKINLFSPRISTFKLGPKKLHSTLRGLVLVTICVFPHSLSNLTGGEGDWRGVELKSSVSPGSLPGKA